MMCFLSGNDLTRLSRAMSGMYEDRVVITLGKHKVSASVVPASPAWHVAMLVRLEVWRPGGYASQYFESVEEMRRYGWTVRKRSGC